MKKIKVSFIVFYLYFEILRSKFSFNHPSYTPNHNHNHKQKTKDYSVDDHPLRRHYLSILGLDPYKHYSYQDIKKAYRRQAKQYHPDKHHHKGKNTWQEMNERFREIKEAYEWLGVYEG